MARPIKRRDNARLTPEPRPVAFAQLPFNPAEFYTDSEIAAKFKNNVRTVKRWRAKGEMPAAVEFNDRTHRTHGDALNRHWQSLTQNSDEETA